jgi:CubicO group peptidase (beta-lactamase class C family)
MYADTNRSSVHRYSRREFLCRNLYAGLVLSGVSTAARAQQHDKPASLPTTGHDNPNLASFDKLMVSFVKEQRVPGASLAVTRKQRLVYARGFGFADVEKKTPVEPDALFRIASITKPFTAVAILHLVDQGKLRLTDKVTDIVRITPFFSVLEEPAC